AISQLNGRELDGRRITVEVSNPQGPRTGGGRPGGGRPGGGGRGPGGGGGRESGYAHRPSKPVRWEQERGELTRTSPGRTKRGAGHSAGPVACLRLALRLHVFRLGGVAAGTTAGGAVSKRRS